MGNICGGSSDSVGGLSKSARVDDFTITAVKNERKEAKLTRNIVHAEFHRDVNEFYELENGIELGTGISGSVRTVKHRDTKIMFACKTLDKTRVQADKLEEMRNEIAFMATLDHPNILRLYEYFETKETIFLIMHLCKGGELLDRLHQQKGSRYGEKQACSYVKEMLSAIRYCHDNGIVHRDLKLENFLLDDESNDSSLKLIDFGLSTYYTKAENNFMRKAVGTPYYVAPEVLRGMYTSGCDIWSLGVIAYMLVSGIAPFYGRTDQEIFRKVKAGRWHFEPKYFQKVSFMAQGFIKSCLNVRDYERPSAAELQHHKWFSILEKDEPDTPLDVIDNLVGFQKRSKFVQVSMEVVAHTLNPEQVRELKEWFVKFDKDLSGEIKVDELKDVIQHHPKFTEEDLHAIFDSIDIEDGGTIRYHEFLAAALSHQNITDGNLRIAFEKISNRTGLITPDDLRDLMGADGTEENVNSLLADVGLSPGSNIDLDTFRRVMKMENEKGEGKMLPQNTPYGANKRRVQSIILNEAINPAGEESNVTKNQENTM